MDTGMSCPAGLPKPATTLIIPGIFMIMCLPLRSSPLYSSNKGTTGQRSPLDCG